MCGQCCKNLALEIETSAEPNGHSKAAAAKIEKQKEINKYIKKGYKDVEASRVTWLKGNDFKFTLTLTCPHLKGNKCVITLAISFTGFSILIHGCASQTTPRAPIL